MDKSMKKLLIISLLTSSISQAVSHLEEVFSQAYYDSITGRYGEIESASGPGSTLKQTEIIRTALPAIIKQFAIKILTP